MLAAVDTDSGYVSVGLLARGGMGDVELGLRTIGSFRRLVAIKRLRSEHRQDPSFRQMFLDEAKIAGLIRHPNVVSVLDVGDDPRGGPFLVMDYVEGVTAGHVLKSASSEGEQIPVQVAARVVHQVCLGLSAAHGLTRADGSSLELIHRDISPQNILIGFDGVSRLTDFGIAKALGSNKNTTTTGLLKGKVGYMSPEQLRFERPTQKSDLFSLGVVLYELLSAKRLYTGKDTVEVAQKILSEPAPDIYSVRDDVPASLIELSFELLAKDPSERPDSAQDVAKRLAEIVDDLGATEGTLRLEEFLAGQFTDEWTKLKTRSESLVREWEVTTSHSPPPRTLGGRKKLWMFVAAAAALSIVITVVAMSGSSEPTPVVSPTPPPAAVVEPPPQEEAIAVEAAEVIPSEEEEAAEAPPPEEPQARDVRPRTRAERRAAARRARSMQMEGAMRDEGFSAIDLIRGTM